MAILCQYLPSPRMKWQGLDAIITMIIRIANSSRIQSTENRSINLEIGLKSFVQQEISASVLNRVILWLKRGRLSKGIEEE